MAYNNKMLIDIHPTDGGGFVVDVVANDEHRRTYTTADTLRDALGQAHIIARDLIDQQHGRIVDADDLERIDGDAYGNPRHVVHWTALGLPAYQHDERTKRAGLSMYRGKKYGGMFIVPGYGTKTQLAHDLTRVFYPESITE